MPGLVDSVKLAIAYSATVLARFGIIDEARGKRIADLAAPRIVTGMARKSKSTVDLAMVGIAVGPAAIAGLAFAFAFWSLANAFGWSFANGAMTFFSQRYGADDERGLDLAIKQTLWILVSISGTLAVVFVLFAEPLVSLMGGAPDSTRMGVTYLQVVAPALVFNVFSQVTTRVLLSANDGWTPMAVRVAGALANIALNALFIFGFGLGVLGAALGTLIASFATAAVLVAGLLLGRLPVVGRFVVRARLGPPYLEVPLMKQILVVGAPLVAKRFVSRGANFVMLALVAYYGTVFVAAYSVAREVRKLANTPAWGFNTAARSLVGQKLGDGAETEAEAYGWDIIRFMVAIYVFTSTFLFAFAGQIAPLFTSDPEAVAVAAPFLMVMAVSLMGLAIDGSCSGIIGAAGDTRWPLYARLVGLYVFMLPLAYLGTVTPLGVFGLYLAVAAETIVPALVTFYRFSTGRWKVVSRQFRPSPSD